MEPENAESVRRLVEAMNRRDRSALASLIHERSEWRPLLTAGGELESRVYLGPEGVSDYWRDLDELFEDVRIELRGLEPVGPDEVLFHGRVTARGRASELPLDVPIWARFSIFEGRMLSGTAYRTEAEARDAPRPDANVELARRGFEAFNRGDIAAVVELLADDVVVRSGPDLPNSGEFHGHAGFLDWARAWLEAWETFQIEMGEVTVLGDAVVVSARQIGSGRGSGLRVEMDIAYVFRVREGKVIGLGLHHDREQAMAAAREDSPTDRSSKQ